MRSSTMAAPLAPNSRLASRALSRDDLEVSRRSMSTVSGASSIISEVSPMQAWSNE